MKGKNYILLMKRWYVMVTIADVNQSNGVIHVVDAVLLPLVFLQLVLFESPVYL
jgi:uncharacterized surface protein with fasciclin (FAS1) repeats